jgi:hypothetical protein
VSNRLGDMDSDQQHIQVCELSRCQHRLSFTVGQRRVPVLSPTHTCCMRRVHLP